MLRTAAVALRALALVAILGSAAHARAQRTSSLSWVRLAGAESCVSTQALAERVEHRIGRRVFVSASQADLSLEGHVERTQKPNGWLATIAVSNREGHVLGRRTLRAAGDRCDALDASLVLVIAIAIDPNAALEDGSDGTGLSDEAKAMLGHLGLPELSEQQLRDELAVPAPAETSPEPQAAQQPANPVPPVRRSQPSKPHPAPAGHASISIFIHARAELGAFPALAGAGVLGVTIHPDFPIAFDFWLTGLIPQRHSLPDANANVNFTLFAAGAGLCPLLFERTNFSIRGCAAAEIGIMSASGSGFANEARVDTPWIEPAAYVTSALRFGRWSIEALLAGGAPIIRDTFSYVDTRAVLHRAQRAAALTARLELGAAMRF